VAILAEQDLLPSEIKAERRLLRAGLFGFLKAKRTENLIIFTRNLATLYRAGIPILRSLAIIRIGPEGSRFNDIINTIRNSVESGRSLADAMAEFPGFFPGIYTASIAAGEASGSLDLILDSLGVMLEKDLQLNRQIKSSIRYPIVVCAAIALAFVVLITFVIPRFVGFYGGMGAELPAPTRLMIWMNQMVTQYWMIVGAIVIATFLIIKKIYSTPNGRLYFDELFLKIPIFGDLLIKGNIARFSYMFQILIMSGTPVVRSLELLAEVIRNSRLSAEIRMLTESFREGRELRNLLARFRFIPEMALQMIQVGLESGSLESMLNEVAEHYNKEVDYKSRHLTALLEPILTVCLAGFVLIVALAIFLPMWNLIQVFRQ